jgi:hypothetical protein
VPTVGVTVILMALDVAGLPVAQDSFDVNTQVMIFPFDGVKEYAGLLVPAFMPFTFH